MMSYRRWTCLVVLSIALLLTTARGAAAGAPTDQLRQHIDEVLKVVQSPEHGTPAEAKVIRTIATKIFDFQETAKRSLGPHWQQRTPPQREEFTKLFTDLLEHSYVTRIQQYAGEKIEYVSETVEGDQATVKTRIVTKKGTEVPIEYRMMRESDQWRVYDVMIEGVSLISNYRTQFNKIIRTSSYDDLIAKMRAKEFSAPEADKQPKQRS